MENKFVITFDLVQDTPMWVFNPDDPGCGLRATEVKPKLDRYLVKEIGKENMPTSWFITDTALDYKMSIQYSSSVPEDTEFENQKGRSVPLYPLYFGNMGGGAKKSLMTFKDIKMTVYTRYEGLLDKIKNNLQAFFACHSFGTRQSKGFGCFRQKDGDFEIPDGAKYKFHVHNDSYEELFMHIHYFHKLIRSGINEGKSYAKSLMFHYMKVLSEERKTKAIWDKPVLRKHFEFKNPLYQYIAGIQGNFKPQIQFIDKERKIKRPQREEIKNEYKDKDITEHKDLYRDALGFATQQTWMKYQFFNPDKINSHGTKKGGYDNEQLQMEVDPTCEIANQWRDNDRNNLRMKSPITYHPIKRGGGYDVYIIINDLPSDAKKLRINFTSNNPDNVNRPLTGMQLDRNFDVEKYFVQVYQWIKLEKNDAKVESRKILPLTLAPNGKPRKYIKSVIDNFDKI